LSLPVLINIYGAVVMLCCVELKPVALGVARAKLRNRLIETLSSDASASR
jgi:hypothetical protein